MPERRIEADAEKRAGRSQPAHLRQDQLAAACGGARSSQGLIAHELTHAAQSGDKAEATSIGKSVARKSQSDRTKDLA